MGVTDSSPAFEQGCSFTNMMVRKFVITKINRKEYKYMPIMLGLVKSYMNDEYIEDWLRPLIGCYTRSIQMDCDWLIGDLVSLHAANLPNLLPDSARLSVDNLHLCKLKTSKMTWSLNYFFFLYKPFLSNWALVVPSVGSISTLSILPWRLLTCTAFGYIHETSSYILRQKGLGSSILLSR